MAASNLGVSYASFRAVISSHKLSELPDNRGNSDSLMWNVEIVS